MKRIRLGSIAERLDHYSTKDPNGCLIWVGGLYSNGYGCISVGNAMSRGAHRVAYEEWVGPIPDGQVVMHLCHNPPCIEPTHLAVGTDAENAAMKVSVGHARGPRKLTEDEVRAIRDRLAQGDVQETIAKDFGVVQATISRIKLGIDWSHVV